MNNEKKFIVSHAPFWHSGSRISDRSYHTIGAALPAVIAGIYYYGIPALGVVALSISTAVIWELLINFASKTKPTIGDGNAVVIGLLFAMLLPATAPFWVVLTGTFLAVVIGKQIFGGIGANPFNPAVLALAMMMVSWKDYFDFNGMLVNYDFGFAMAYPLGALKQFGTAAVDQYSVIDLFLGKQAGGLGSTFGLGLVLGGLYLIRRGVIRWEIPLSFLAGIFITALLFNLYDGSRFTGPLFHIFTGYTLIAAFFLATEDSSSPVNFIPMLIYGACGGCMVVLIRNIGAHVDGVVYAILLMNLINPLVDKIRPVALGKVG